MSITCTEPAPQVTPQDRAPARGPSRPPAPTRSGFRAWTARHPVGALLLIGFSLGYPVMFLPILASHGVIPDGWMPQIAGVDTERISSVLLVFAALLPAVAWVTWAADGTDGLRTLRRRMLQWRIGVRWWLLLLAALPTVTLGLALLLGDSPEQVDVVPLVTAQVIGLLVNLVLINIWEEAAWAGIVQTRLQERHGLVRAALLTAVPFALIHMPLHFIGAFTLSSLVGALVALLIICALVRLMLGVVLSGTRGSILAVAVMHTMFNRSNNDEGIVAGLVDGDGRKLAGLLAVLVVTTVVAVVVRRRRTGTDPS
jgi:membrane protease YdiL (CAAX protease family)